MSQAAVKLEPETVTVTQFWLMQKVEPRQEQHTYEINGEFFCVLAYCNSLKDARCMRGRREHVYVAEVEIPDYDDSIRIAHKKEYFVKKWY